MGTLTGFNMPFGDCVDGVGDVWIINQHPPEVIEYAHGGTTPIATLTTDAGPYACAIDLNALSECASRYNGEMEAGGATRRAINEAGTYWRKVQDAAILASAIQCRLCGTIPPPRTFEA